MTSTIKDARQAAIEWARDMLASGFLILDCKTTGLDAAVDQPVEINVVDGDNIVFHRRVRPSVTIKPIARQAHGIHLRDLRGVPTLGEIAVQLRAVLAGRRVVIFNADFEVALLSNALQGCPDVARYFDAEFFCAMQAYMKFTGTVRSFTDVFKRYSLMKACKREGIEITNECYGGIGMCLLVRKLVEKMAAS